MVGAAKYLGAALQPLQQPRIFGQRAVDHHHLADPQALALHDLAQFLLGRGNPLFARGQRGKVVAIHFQLTLAAVPRRQAGRAD